MRKTYLALIGCVVFSLIFIQRDYISLLSFIGVIVCISSFYQENENVEILCKDYVNSSSFLFGS